MDIGELAFFQLGGGPFGCFLDVGGICETRTVDVGQVAHDFHNFGIAKAFFLDLMDGGKIRLAGRLRRQGQNRQQHCEHY
jgi:hypothetical protein